MLHSTDLSVITSVITVTVWQPFLKRSEEFPRHAPVHNLQDRALFAGLAKFAAAEISSACECLSISPKVTVTNTITAPTPVSRKTSWKNTNKGFFQTSPPLPQQIISLYSFSISHIDLVFFSRIDHYPVHDARHLQHNQDLQSNRWTL